MCAFDYSLFWALSPSVFQSVPRGSTFESLSPILAQQGAEQLITVLKDLAATRQRSKPQAHSSTNKTVVASTPDRRATAPRIPKAAGEILFAIHTPETLYRIWASCKGFTPTFSTFDGQRILIHQLIHPLDAAERIAKADQPEAATHTTSTASTPASSSSSSTSHFPTFVESQQSVGLGGLFYEPRLNAIGLICASSTLEQPQVLYISEVQLAGKKNPVQAHTFASGYMDKRKVKKPEQRQGWKFTQSPMETTVDFFGPKL